jgi:hypothetical protein
VPTVSGVRLRRWLLLCALALAVIGMHHVASGTGGPCTPDTASAIHSTHLPEASGQTPCPSHDMLHMCLAVFVTAGGVLLLVAIRTAYPPRPAALVARRRRRRRTPGRLLLTSVCVLRI